MRQVYTCPSNSSDFFDFTYDLEIISRFIFVLLEFEQSNTFDSIINFSKVKSNFRNAITIPEKCWSRFRDILCDYCDKMKKSSSNPAIGGPAGGTISITSSINDSQQPALSSSITADNLQQNSNKN
jgi:PurA ssDNA and RNA-binding protein